jgi:hypothetical protein
VSFASHCDVKNMNQLSADELTCADLMSTVEQELGAFFRAVTELFGSARWSSQLKIGCTSSRQ